VQSTLQNVNASWLVYDFNDDREDLVSQLIDGHQVTHVFVYLVPKQLALLTVRTILTKLCGSGVVSAMALFNFCAFALVVWCRLGV